MRAPMLLVASWALCGCRAIVDSDVTYCNLDLSHYEDEFPIGMTTEQLYEKCWRVANADDRSEVFVDDGDLIMRIVATDRGEHLAWQEADQGPMAYQRFMGDFIVVARLEALKPADASHCLEPDNVAGLAVRSVDQPGDWATFLMGPYDVELYDCTDESMDLPPTKAQILTSNPSWGESFVTTEDIGYEGDAFLSICRLGDTAEYTFTPSTPPMAPPLREPRVHSHAVSGPVDVGPALSARTAPFEIEGHFDWIAYSNVIGADGCKRAREDIVLPSTEP
jgi:hypothetical protein